MHLRDTHRDPNPPGHFVEMPVPQKRRQRLQRPVCTNARPTTHDFGIAPTFPLHGEAFDIEIRIVRQLD